MSQPSAAPLAIYSSSFCCRTVKSSEGERNSATKAGHKGGKPSFSSAVSRSQRVRSTQARSGERLAPLGSVKPVDESKPMPVASRSTHWPKSAVIEVTAARLSCGGHDDQVSFTAALDAQIAIQPAEHGKVLVIHHLDKWTQIQDHRMRSGRDDHICAHGRAIIASFGASDVGEERFVGLLRTPDRSIRCSGPFG